MMMPSIFGEKLFDSFFDDSFPFFYNDRDLKKAEKKLYGRKGDRMMKTDIREKADGYELLVDLPGFKKDEIQIELKDGYLTVSAEKGLDKDEEDKKGKYIRKERYAGALSRTFYLGEEIREEEIKAKFENGILSVSIPKEEEKKVEGPKHISIEG